MASKSVFFFVPNIIDYIRLVLLVFSLPFYYSNPSISLLLYVLSASLDAVDGYFARKLNQESAFGAWLDVVIDNVGRSMLWCRVWEFGFIVASLEWLTFVCNHTHGHKWKSKIAGPWLVERVMHNNFRGAWGVVALGGLNVLPVWVYILDVDIATQFFVPEFTQHLITSCLIMGRTVCAAVEVWCIYLHVIYLASDEDSV